MNNRAGRTAHRDLTFCNRQRARRVNLELLHEIAAALLNKKLSLRRYDLAIHLVSAGTITRLNERFLRHAGSTDVIAFSYAPRRSLRQLHGELFVCVDEAIAQSARYRTTWQEELTRYLVHGVLHLVGHDDDTPKARRTMKICENRLLRQLAREFPLRALGPRERRNGK